LADFAAERLLRFFSILTKEEIVGVVDGTWLIALAIFEIALELINGVLVRGVGLQINRTMSFLLLIFLKFWIDSVNTLNPQ
jgi:hypothetical protein